MFAVFAMFASMDGDCQPHDPAVGNGAVSFFAAHILPSRVPSANFLIGRQNVFACSRFHYTQLGFFGF
jgi:hypothetical protein